MRPAEFEYRRCESIAQATGALLESQGAVVLAGGQSLIPMLRSRLARPEVVLDISGLSDLKGIERRDGVLDIGALCTTARMEGSDTVKAASPIASDATSVIADPAVRNMGTIGGNLAHADPLNDLPAVLVAANGHVVVVGPDGERRIGADDLFNGPFATTLRRGEIIKRVVLEASPAGAYEKFKRAAVDFGVAGVAVQLLLDDEKRVTGAGIAVTGSVDTAARAAEAEEILIGSKPTSNDIDRAATATSKAARLVDDDRGSARYQSAVVTAMARSAMRRAIKRAEAVAQ